jgi:hypothetical protein
VLSQPGAQRLQRDGGLLPSEKIAIAVVVTYLPGAFDNQGNYPNYSDTMFRAIGAVVAPKDPPPPLPS